MLLVRNLIVVSFYMKWFQVKIRTKLLLNVFNIIKLRKGTDGSDCNRKLLRYLPGKRKLFGSSTRLTNVGERWIRMQEPH